jgi:hypothetical protein
MSSVFVHFEYFIYIFFQGECAMPIELLVPVAIFALGVAVAIYLSNMGIECIVEDNKK